MVWSSVLAVAAALARGIGGAGPAPTVALAIDSSHHELQITSGPFDLPNMPPMEAPMGAPMMDLSMSHDTPVQTFVWPVDGWLRGFKIDLVDGQGHAVPRQVIHHLIMINYSRRQLLYSAAERLMGAGSETDPELTLPKTIGIPMKNGMRLGMYVAWHNETGRNLNGVYLKLTMLWTPRNQNPQPINAMPIYMDVNLTVGGTNTFDVPPGHSSKSYEFTLPTGGRLLGVGGHMHDYGTRVRLEDAETGKLVTEVIAKRSPDGKLEGMSRKLFAVTGSGLRMKAGHRYRVVAEYDNPTGVLRLNGAMAHMVGLFVPDDMKRWPAINPEDPTYRRDLASLQVRGGTHHSMPSMPRDPMGSEQQQH